MTAKHYFFPSLQNRPSHNSSWGFALIALLLLLGLQSLGQAPGDPAIFMRGTGVADTKTYFTKVNSSLYSIGSGGSFSLLPQSTFLTPAQGNAAYQPLSSTLTSLSGISTTSFGRGFLSLADASAARTYIGAGTSSFDGAYSSLSGIPLTFSPAAHTHVSADITNASTGGNGASDAAKLVKFRSDGGIYASGSTAVALLGLSVSGDGVNASSTDGDGGQFSSITNAGVRAGAQGAEPAVVAVNAGNGYALDASSNTGINIARFTDGTGTGLTILADGTIDWDSSTGASGTVQNLPAFTSSSVGTVPASGGGTANYLRADGTWSAPVVDAVADGSTKGIGSFAASDFNSSGGNISIDYANGQEASGSADGFLSSTDWSTFNSKPSGTSGTETAYTGTITFGFSSGTSAPSGSSNLRQFYTLVGNCVTWQISLVYASAGTNVNNVTLTFPTQFPAPSIPTGFTGASVKLWNCAMTRLLTSPTASPTNGNGYMISRNSGDTGFEISSATFSAGAYRVFIFSGTYFTQ